ncbi:MAG: alpha/beta hydrolase [Verrucomicrobiota bacterium]|nr:alpha/beta hydrolase [Verrucomicrobiota bacterium]
MKSIALLLAPLCILCGHSRAEALADSTELTTGDRALHKLLGEGARTLPLWPEEAPDEPRPIDAETVGPLEKKSGVLLVHNVTEPTLTLLMPQKAAQPVPRGGHLPGRRLRRARHRDGRRGDREVAERARMAGIVLKYRVPKRHRGYAQHHHALQDAQRAMGLIRQHASEWNVDARRLGVVGFSAGGHLAATLSNNYGKRLYPGVDAADDLSCKPDFTVLIYPAYVTEPIDSDTLDPLQRASQMSRAATPPTFIAVAQNDKFARGATAYFMALRQARVPAELHIYDGGGHGNALREAPLSEWGQTCARWLAARWPREPSDRPAQAAAPAALPRLQ